MLGGDTWLAFFRLIDTNASPEVARRKFGDSDCAYIRDATHKCGSLGYGAWKSLSGRLISGKMSDRCISQQHQSVARKNGVEGSIASLTPHYCITHSDNKKPKCCVVLLDSFIRTKANFQGSSWLHVSSNKPRRCSFSESTKRMMHLGLLNAS